MLTALLGSSLGVMANSIGVLNIARLLQGVGAGAISLNARAMSRDLYSGKQLATLSAYLGTAIGIAPALAPLLGGYLQHAFAWPAIFVFMLGWLALVLFLVTTLLPETNSHRRRTGFSLQTMLSHYQRLLHTPSFVTHTLYAALSFAIIMIYYTISPHLLQVHYHLSVLEYSWSCFGMIAMIITSRMLNVILLRLFPPFRLIRFGVYTALLSSCVLALSTAFSTVPISLLLSSTSGIMLGLGFIISNTMAQAFSQVRDIAGSAAALYGVTLAASAGVCSTIAAQLVADHAGSFSYFSLLLLVLATVIACHQLMRQKQHSMQYE